LNEVSSDLNIAQLRQQIETGVSNARQQLQNYRAFAELMPVNTAEPPPRKWAGFIMLVRRPLPPIKAT